MTSREQYELIWEKAEKYNRLVVAIAKIGAEIQAIIDEERTGNGNINKGVVIGLQMALDTINRYKAESEVDNEMNDQGERYCTECPYFKDVIYEEEQWY